MRNARDLWSSRAQQRTHAYDVLAATISINSGKRETGGWIVNNSGSEIAEKFSSESCPSLATARWLTSFVGFWNYRSIDPDYLRSVYRNIIRPDLHESRIRILELSCDIW